MSSKLEGLGRGRWWGWGRAWRVAGLVQVEVEARAQGRPRVRAPNGLGSCYCSRPRMQACRHRALRARSRRAPRRQRLGRVPQREQRHHGRDGAQLHDQLDQLICGPQREAATAAAEGGGRPQQARQHNGRGRRPCAAGAMRPGRRQGGACAAPPRAGVALPASDAPCGAVPGAHRSCSGRRVGAPACAARRGPPGPRGRTPRSLSGR